MTGQQVLALSPLLIIGGTVVLVMLVIAIKRHHGWTARIAGAGLVLALLPVVLQFGLPGVFKVAIPQNVTALLVIDNYARLYMAMILVASLATATTMCSLPSSVVPIEKTFTRGVDLARRRM